MSRESVNERAVMEPAPAPPPPRESRTFDYRYTCDFCGDTVTVESKLQEDGSWRPDSYRFEPDGWGQLSGFEWATPIDFCSFECEVNWLDAGRWRPLVEKERQRHAEATEDKRGVRNQRRRMTVGSPPKIT